MTSNEDPQPGTKSTATTTVTGSLLATSLHLSRQDNYPPVWATAHMIALMEIASARILEPLLTPVGQLSAGVDVNIRHSKPTPLGATVWAEAEYVGKKGRLYEFRVAAYDAGGKVGEGTHTRGVMKQGMAEEVARGRCKL